MSEPIIKLDNVHLTLTSRAGPVHILRGVSLAIPQGQSAAIVGPSGSGKTRLLMVMAGLERATSGQIAVAGQRLETCPRTSLPCCAAPIWALSFSRSTWCRR